MPETNHSASIIPELIRERILLLDGAMGTMIQRLGLDEAGVRGERFADHHKDLKNFSDILCLTHPEKITDIHSAYYEAGSDIVETNSFGASPVGMVEFDLPLELVDEINHAAVACARKAADMWTERTPDKPRFVAGSIGPTTKQRLHAERRGHGSDLPAVAKELLDGAWWQHWILFKHRDARPAPEADGTAIRLECPGEDP